MVKFPVIRGMCLFLMKNGADPGFVIAGYHRTIAKQFTQRSGHQQTDRIDWKELNNLQRTIVDSVWKLPSIGSPTVFFA